MSYKGTGPITEFILQMPDKYINVNVLNFYADMRDKKELIQRVDRFTVIKQLNDKEYKITEIHDACLKYIRDKISNAIVFLEYKNMDIFNNGHFKEIIYLSEFDDSVEFSRLYELDKISKEVDVNYVIINADSYKKFVLNKL